MTKLEFTTEDFKKWLDDNRLHLKDYTIAEVTFLAIQCGFTQENVSDVIPSWRTRSELLSSLWESPVKEQWYEHFLYTSYGKTWDEE